MAQLIENPLAWFWILLLVGGCIRYLGRAKAGMIINSFAFIWLVASSSTPLPQWLIVHLESRFLTIDSMQVPDSSLILVLGGGHTVAPQLTPGNQLSSDALARVTEALRLYGKCRGCRLVLSGYSSSGRTTQAEVLALTALSLGASAMDTLQMREPGNTRDEILAFIDRFGASRPTVLVTSAVHMPRAVAWCGLLGLRVLPAPAGHLVKIDEAVSTYDFIPAAQKLTLMQKAIHEHLGMLAFWWSRSRVSLVMYLAEINYPAVELILRRNR